MIHRSTLLILAYLTVLGSLPGAAKARLNPEVSAIVIAQTSESSAPSAQAETLDKRDVLNLQLRLQSLGYYNQAVDGIYGEDTVEAIKRFQADSDLPATGVVDSITLERLQNPQLISPNISAEQPQDSPEATEDPDPAPTESTETPASQTDSDETPNVPEAVEEPEAPPEETPPPAADGGEATPQTNSGNRWLLWLVLAAVGIGSLGGGLIIATRSGQAQAEDEDAQEEEDEIDPRTAIADVKVNSSQASQPQTDVTLKTPKGSPAAQPSTSANGHKPEKTESERNNSDVSPSAASNQISQPTQRLPRLGVIEALVEDLQSSTPAKRKRAIWELGQRGSSVALQPLVNLLLDADSKERSLILAAVSEISARSLKPMNQALAIALQDPNPEVRKNAIRDITRVYDLTAQAAQILAHVQTDTDPEVQATAKWALGQLGRLRTIAMQEGQPTLPDSPMPPADLLPEESQQQS